ncbi:putative cytochrome P450 [Helianthus annuus]|uniref:Cytochrome P450 n=1 Tax=Helianthus annuus TaxID=4232 RepID=A0A251T900_HELAN|nr:cytochrome P450 84A1 [Helianthus annuus]KAF5780398.1 putative cytochrome P450 [Helianthus annuus]KAJ0500219.1 putative cytochrome P450 [Helianthus annuus]KAJ0507582.1 putative cytochrome P450 [Helianthus annuus]KAJ0516051.1 putative cytochrome P450 [Helianthus annuus]KAJ0684068.1 putative cytochrome P450 [Helianthus annuus]
MDSIQFSIPIYALISLSTLFFLVAWLRRKPLPPGPMGWPIIGNMLMMDQLTHRGLARLAEKYGGILHLKMGFSHTIAVSSPEMAREILQVQDHIFANRPATIAITYLTYDRVDMAFADYGPFWRQMRKLSVMKLFSRKRAESWDSVRDEVDSMVKSTAVNSGSPVNLGELVFGLTHDIIYRAAFGSISHESKEEFISILQEYTKLFGAFNLADFIPWLGFIDPAGLNTRLPAARAALDRFIDKIIDDHLTKREKIGDQNADKDMVDEMLEFYSVEGKVNEAEILTRDNIKAIIMDVMFGGTETVASAIEWAMTELMHTPEALKRVQQELANVVGLERQVEEADLEKLTYFKCVIKETLRLHPPIPVALHKSSADTTVMGYHIPKGSRVMVNAYAINRDKNSWEDPNTFNPSRFLQNGAPDFRGSNYEFLPFGSGRRSCPGMQLGLYAMEMALVHLLHCFTWELPDGMKPSEIDMVDVFGLTAPKAIRLVAVPTPRLLCPLY